MEFRISKSSLYIIRVFAWDRHAERTCIGHEEFDNLHFTLLFPLIEHVREFAGFRRLGVSQVLPTLVTARYLRMATRTVVCVSETVYSILFNFLFRSSHRRFPPPPAQLANVIQKRTGNGYIGRVMTSWLIDDRYNEMETKKRPMNSFLKLPAKETKNE